MNEIGALARAVLRTDHVELSHHTRAWKERMDLMAEWILSRLEEDGPVRRKPIQVADDVPSTAENALKAEAEAYGEDQSETSSDQEASGGKAS